MISTLRKRHQTIVSNKKRRYSSRTRKRRTSKRGRCALIISVAAFFILLCCVIVSFILRNNRDNTVQAQKILPKLSIQTKLIQKNKYSRPGIALRKVKGVVVHYTANPGTDAEDNRNYFNNLPKLNAGKQKATYASSHFVIGLEGQIVQCIPLNWTGKSYSAYQPGRLHMRPIHGILIRCPLSAVIREKMESLTMQPIRRLLNWFRICV